VAALLRRELGSDVEMVHGAYGDFQVLVDGQSVIGAGALSAIGILPSAGKILEAVRARLERDSRTT
jgi:hypothetical protein